MSRDEAIVENIARERRMDVLESRITQGLDDPEDVTEYMMLQTEWLNIEFALGQF